MDCAAITMWKLLDIVNLQLHTPLFMSVYYLCVGLGHGDGYKDDSLDVYQYFNTGCYSGYGDDEKVR